ncbi:ABC transporter ATP-binding protein [Streptomyces sp. NPDC051041]|uniref:ABC transporter ATP-binding protein n=1 Tax=Streptomyces sp. NPDC051041 TaxID=3365640 RepID=UPI00378EDCD4
MSTPTPRTAPSAEPVVELVRVCRRYPGTPPVDAVRDVSLRVERGELLAIIGPSGSGKSTLLNLLGTLDRPTSGEISLAGYPTAELSDRGLSALRARYIGFVFQQFFLTPGMPALDSVADGLLYSGLPRGARRAAAAETLERVGLRDRMRHRPHELSGGERQRVALARAVVGRPLLLLADEPTGALDSASGATVVGLLRELHRQGTTVVVITHDLELAGAMPRRIHMRDGRIESDSGPGDAAPVPDARPAGEERPEHER